MTIKCWVRYLFNTVFKIRLFDEADWFPFSWKWTCSPCSDCGECQWHGKPCKNTEPVEDVK